MMVSVNQTDDASPTRPGSSRTPTRLGPAVDSLPGLARVAASAAWHTAGWGVKSSAKGWIRVGRALTDQGEAAALARDAGQAVAAVGVLARSMTSGVPAGDVLMSVGEALGGIVEHSPPASPVIKSQNLHHRSTPSSSLRERGQELLHKSRDVWNTDDGHPAYERILEELAPDEARILMLLVSKGPQPSVDVRTGGPAGMVNSQLLAPGLNMIGPRAGCRRVEQVPSYLNNLSRLGLVWFSRESLRDPMDYQVVEAQPDVLGAMHSVRFAKVVRRSIHLTPFGKDFCAQCLLEEEVVQAALPEHDAPPAGTDPAEPV